VEQKGWAKAVGGERFHPILGKLAGGDRRSIGRADEVAEEIVADEALFAAVVSGMLHSDPVIRMRAADAVEKASQTRPDLLQPHKERLLGEIAGVNQQEVRWHLSLMLARLRLDDGDRRRVLAILDDHLQDESRIVKVNAMQALAELGLRYEDLRKHAVEQLERLTREGSPAMKARGRKLLKALGSRTD